jgi:hypothetical protein
MLAWNVRTGSACAALSAEKPIAKRSAARKFLVSRSSRAERELCRLYLVYSVIAMATRNFYPSPGGPCLNHV